MKLAYQLFIAIHPVIFIGVKLKNLPNIFVVNEIVKEGVFPTDISCFFFLGIFPIVLLLTIQN